VEFLVYQLAKGHAKGVPRERHRPDRRSRGERYTVGDVWGSEKRKKDSSPAKTLISVKKKVLMINALKYNVC
jgi:hypothetical protein